MQNGNIPSWPGWETVRRIGKGGFGAVYEIRRDVLGETEKAALKVITIPQDDSELDEFYSEGYGHDSIANTFKSHMKSIVAEYSLMRKMNGTANIVSCDDVRFVQHDDGIGWDIFIKMELLTPLAAAVPMEVPEDVVVKVARDMCAALELCKKYDIVHRDIKPQNIFLSPNGDYKLGDFGIARTMEKTMGATKIGTFAYMAPEVNYNRPYGASADIYSLGLVLYWLLNDRRLPFLPDSSDMPSFEEKEIARLRRFAGEAIPAPRRGSKDLQKIVLKACAYDPKERYQSGQEMLEDLNGIQHTAPVVISDIAIPDPQKPEKSEPDDKTAALFYRSDSDRKPVEQKKYIPQTEPDDKTAALFYGSNNSRKAEEQKKDDLRTEPDDQTEALFYSPNYNRQTKSDDKTAVLPYRTHEGRNKAVSGGAERIAGTAAPKPRNEKTRRPKKKKPLWGVALLPLALFAIILLMVFVTEKLSDFRPDELKSDVTEPVVLDVLAYDHITHGTEWWADFERDFEAANENIDLVVDVLPWDEFDTEVNRRIADGNAPDILLNIDAFADYQADGLLLPAQDYVSGETYAKFYQSLLDQSMVDGTVWAVPGLANCRAMYYNVDILNEVGVEVPATWDELVAVSQAIQNHYGDKVCPWGVDLDTLRGQESFAYHIWNNGGGFTDAEGNWTLNSAENVEAIEFLVDMVNAGLTSSDGFTDDYFLNVEMFGSGRVAMIMGNRYTPTYLAESGYVVNWGIAPIPTNTGVSVSPATINRFICFDNDYSEAELAAVTTFFDYFYEDERYIKECLGEIYLPATRSSAEMMAAADPAMAPWVEIIGSAKCYPDGKEEWPYVAVEVIDVLQNALIGVDVRTLLDDLQREFAG